MKAVKMKRYACHYNREIIGYAEIPADKTPTPEELAEIRAWLVQFYVKFKRERRKAWTPA